ncbi:hypothetical protein WN944_019624 [Citrus x changshan-huyou]|uniref:Protein BOLA4 n=2 Tax=Citrus TaxID=2706 RepID=A0ACB8LCL8_CITSI|nr:protein BOLA4 [Citrus sinensis]
MATKTLISRPYIFSSSSRSLCCFFIHPKRSFVSQTRTFLNGSQAQTSSSLLSSCNSGNRTKLPIQSDGQSRFGRVGHRRFSTGATHVNDAGSIDPSRMASMENKIKEHLNAESVTVKDAYGDGRHVSIDVIASAFEGQSAVNRQRMVYKAIWEELQSTVHAVDSMTTKTPAEADVKK